MIELKLADFDAAIFDMDGTMINNMSFHRDAWLAFAKRYGQDLTPKEFAEKFSGKKNDQLFEMFFNKKLNKEEITLFTEEKEGMYRALYAKAITEISGLTKVLKELQLQNKKLAIATTAPKANRDFGLEALGLTDIFLVILGDEHVTNGKPHPEIYLKTAEQLEVQPNRCLVFEDSPPGVKAGINAGMKVVGVLSTHAKEDLRDADYFIHTYKEKKFI